MPRKLIAALLLAVPATSLAAQSTGTPVFHAPYRGFSRYEIGANVSDAGNIAVEGFYGWSPDRARWDVGLRLGVLDRDPGKTALLTGVDARFRLIATDGVFSMDGVIANLEGICDLADKYDAMVMVDDSHAVGFIGKHGRGAAEYCGVEGRVDIITGTLGKALGGASGGYTAASGPVVEWLRQRSRPYLFSNTLMPAIAGATLRVLDHIEADGGLRRKLQDNAARFRAGMEKLGFTLAGADHPIIPIMIGDAALASQMADRLLERGIYVIGFSFPVVPKGQARIRTQMSAAHSADDIDRAIAAFGDVGRELGVIS